MANNCYNLLKFFGNEKVVSQVKEWKTQLDKIQPTEDDPECLRAIREVFYPESPDNEPINYGSKWVILDNNSNSPEEDEISLMSAWNPPLELQKRIASLLHKLDKHVVVENFYNTDNNYIGFAYTTPYDSENAYSQLTEVKIESDEDFGDEDYDPQADQEQAEARLLEERAVILDYLMDDMQGTAKVIKKFIPNLNVDWDFHK